MRAVAPRRGGDLGRDLLQGGQHQPIVAAIERPQRLGHRRQCLGDRADADGLAGNEIAIRHQPAAVAGKKAPRHAGLADPERRRQPHRLQAQSPYHGAASTDCISTA